MTPPPVPNPIIATPTVSAPATVTNAAIYASPNTSVTPSVSPMDNSKVADSNAAGHTDMKDVQPDNEATGETGGSGDTVSLMVGNAAYMCTMVTDVIGFFYHKGQWEMVVFPQKPSRTHCNFLPKLQLLNVKLNMPCSMMQKSVSSWIQGLLPAESSKK